MDDPPPFERWPADKWPPPSVPSTPSSFVSSEVNSWWEVSKVVRGSRSVWKSLKQNRVVFCIACVVDIKNTEYVQLFQGKVKICTKWEVKIVENWENETLYKIELEM